MKKLLLLSIFALFISLDCSAQRGRKPSSGVTVPKIGSVKKAPKMSVNSAPIVKNTGTSLNKLQMPVIPMGTMKTKKSPKSK